MNPEIIAAVKTVWHVSCYVIKMSFALVVMKISRGWNA